MKILNLQKEFWKILIIYISEILLFIFDINDIFFFSIKIILSIYIIKRRFKKIFYFFNNKMKYIIELYGDWAIPQSSYIKYI